MRRTTLINAASVPGMEGTTPDSSQRRGSLKIFFGYAPCAGTTTAMLEEAGELTMSGRDVLITGVDSAGGIQNPEFDVDMAIARNPDFVVVENLSETNPAGSRNKVRYQDVEELLHAGVNVYSTMHVGDLKNEQQRISELGLSGPESPVPDYVFYGAQQLEFVDLSPSELVERSQALGIEVPDLDTLAQLREIARRCVGDFAAKSTTPGAMSYLAASRRDHVVAYVEANSAPGDIILAAARVAALTGATVDVVCVRPQFVRTGASSEEEAFSRLFDQVADMGYDLETLYGDDVAQVLTDYLRTKSASDVVLARHKVTWPRRLLFPVQLPVEERIGEHIGNVRIHLVNLETYKGAGASARFRPFVDLKFSYVAVSVIIVLAGALVARLVVSLGFAEAVGYLIVALSVALASALTRSYTVGGIAVFTAAIALDYLFVNPVMSLEITRRASMASLAASTFVLALVAVFVCRMTRAASRSRRRERHTQALYDLNRSLVYAHGLVEVVDTSLDAVTRLFDRSAVLYTRDPFATGKTDTRGNHVVRCVPGDLSEAVIEKITEQAVAHWVFVNADIAGNGAPTHGESDIYYLPLSTRDDVRGVLGVSAKRPLDQADRSFLDLVANQITLAFERQALEAEHVEDKRLARVIQIRDAFLGGIAESALVSADLVRDISDTLSKASDETYSDSLMRLCSDESSRSSLVLGRVLGEVQQSSALPSCDMRAEVSAAVDDVRAGLAGKVIDFAPGDPIPSLTADGVLIRYATSILLQSSTSCIGTGGIVNVAIHDYPDRVSVVVADDRPAAANGLEAAAFESATIDEGILGLAYDHRRAHAIREVAHNAQLALGSNEEYVEALSRAMGVPLEIVRDSGQDGALNRRRLTRFDRLEYGLYVTALVVRAHGGTIKQRYRLGGGAVVSFTLPRES